MHRAGGTRARSTEGMGGAPNTDFAHPDPVDQTATTSR